MPHYKVIRHEVSSQTIYFEADDLNDLDEMIEETDWAFPDDDWENSWFEVIELDE